MKTYIILHEGELLFPKRGTNKRGFYEKEIDEIKKHRCYKDARFICIEEEIEKYNLKTLDGNTWGLDEEVYSFKLWYDAYIDNNLNGFSIPIKAKDNNDYIISLRKTLDKYVNYLDRPAFAYEYDLLPSVKKVCETILEVLDNLIREKKDIAENKILDILRLFENDTFFIGELDKMYSFRGIAPFIDFRIKGYDKNYKKMMEEKLTFFRVRTRKFGSKEQISEVEHMLHLPYDKKDKASSTRFSISGVPCLYLGTTSYVCAKECKWDNNNEELFASVFIPNEKGKKLKILNLTISEALINGIYSRGGDNCKKRKELQISMLKIFPIVLASSFSLEKEDEIIRYEYLLPQALMNGASRKGIDGIAYLSMKGKNEFQYPQGVNLAIPALDISQNKLYSEKCRGFEISIPVLYDRQEGKKDKSYINIICKNHESVLCKVWIDEDILFYRETSYAKFDDFLIESMEKSGYNREVFEK